MMSGGPGGGGLPPPPPPYPNYASPSGATPSGASSPAGAGVFRGHLASPGGSGMAMPGPGGSGMIGMGPGGGLGPSGAAAASFNEAEERQRVRFQTELEFVQCLGNPNYLHFLAQRGYFKDSSFINYLNYLQYWKEPSYVRFIKYPVCLHFLELLQHEAFRKEMVNGHSAKFLDDQTILSWQHYTRKRIKLLEGSASAHQAASQATPGSSASTTASQNQFKEASKMTSVS